MTQNIFAKHENSFEAVAREWAVSYFVNKSESHKARTLKRLENYIFPWLKNKAIDEITAPEVL
jgi:integrase